MFHGKKISPNHASRKKYREPSIHVDEVSLSFETECVKHSELFCQQDLLV